MKKETKKQNLLRRLEENREFFMATRKIAYASFMEELADYIEQTESTEEIEAAFYIASERMWI